MVLTDFLKGIADAIRYAEDSTAEINAQSFEARIRALKGAQPIPPTPIRPVIPDGYWQFKETTPYKYVILGTDDSTASDPYVYRLIRSYGLKYTCNVIADYMDRRMNSDVIEGFTSSDAPSLFASAPTTREFLEACKDRDDIEFALHGTSDEHLLDSRKVTDELWGSYYAYYTSQGGTKSLADFKVAVLENVADYDIAQNAPYVERSRKAIEDIIGKSVDTCGIWGGTASVKVDNIEVPTTELDSKEYDWRGNGYTALGYYLVGKYTPSYGNRSADYIRRLQRDSGGFGDFVEDYNLMKVGDCIELFVHFADSADIANHKQYLSTIKEYVDANKVRVVTRKEYAELGEYVSNPITSISVTRSSNSLNVGDTDSKNEYTVTATYADNTSADVTAEAIVEFITDTSEAKIVQVPAYYRGFESSVTITVEGSSSIMIEAIEIPKVKIATDAKITSASTVKSFMYKVEPNTTVYLNCAKLNTYYLGFTENGETATGTVLENYSSPRMTPSNYEIAVPNGMNYLYIYCASYATDMWTVSTQPIS